MTKSNQRIPKQALKGGVMGWGLGDAEVSTLTCFEGSEPLLSRLM